MVDARDAGPHDERDLLGIARRTAYYVVRSRPDGRYHLT
jgi:hypothetical protein